MKSYILALAFLLSWQPTIQPTGVTIKAYRVWRSVGTGKLKDYVNAVKTTSFPDSNIIKGQKYCYAVQTVSTAGVTSALSTPICGTAQ